ncbi:hypothetical protein M407DRAFT_22702 [Tulasnella calospora MUT 4182]|uniref:F-box domain-containing protein n=1 Tax=Tulasnella calospora MUT 4182 TaxID=1051891 RepID=A0A0C3QKU5_9AGAM|nr:hypothetical protein M407DRAFT_22702 [Tulasnella calospora MUT 4182]
MTMHPALEVPEILCLIFRSHLGKHHLFSCSVVCRLWGIWASDILWRTAPVPLWAVFQPLTLITETSEASVEIANIEEPAWRQFLTLASKITVFKVDRKIGAASLERIKLAKQTFNGEPFRQVTTLEMEIDEPHGLIMDLFTTPSLNSVSLWFRNIEDSGITWVANCLPAMAPKLTHLFISFGHFYGSLNVSQYSALQHFQLDGQGVQARFWESLATCPLLRKVRLWCMDVWGDSPANRRADLVYFPALCRLEIWGHCRVFFKIILRSRMPMLETVWWHDDPTMADCFISRIVAHLKLYSPKIGAGRLWDPKKYMCYFGTSDYEDSAIDTDVDIEYDSDGSEICY